MERIKEIKPKFSIETICTGYGWKQGEKIPCGTKWKISEDDIIKRKITKKNKCTDNYYGFICPECNCYTQLELIPKEIEYSAKLYPGQEYKIDNAFYVGDVIEIEKIDFKQIKPIRCNDWEDSQENILYSLCGCDMDRIYPTVLDAKSDRLIIGFRTAYLHDNYYIIEVPFKAILARKVELPTDIHEAVEFNKQSYFYINEDECYVYVLAFFYYMNRAFRDAIYQNIPYDKIKDPKKYWFKKCLENPTKEIPYEKCYIQLSDIFNKEIIVKIPKKKYNKYAIPIFDQCECLDNEKIYIKNILLNYIKDFGIEKIKTIEEK